MMVRTQMIEFDRSDTYTVQIDGNPYRLESVTLKDGERRATVAVAKPQPPFRYRVAVASLPEIVRAVLR